MPQVLIVDDNSKLRSSISRFLEREGHSVQSATSVDEALLLLGHHPFDVIVTEIEMPGRTGIELVEAISTRGLEIETILITAQASVESVRAATWAGAYDYLVKPIPGATLAKVVASAAKVKALRRRGPARATSSRPLFPPQSELQLA